MEQRVTQWHVLKCWPDHFNAIVDGRKRYETRSGKDRDFGVGDVLVLREFQPGEGFNNWPRKGYTGRVAIMQVSYVTCTNKDMGLDLNDCVVMSIEPWNANEVTKPFVPEFLRYERPLDASRFP